MSKKSKKNKSIEPFSFDNENLDYQSIAKSWDLDMATQSDDSISLPDDQSSNSIHSKKESKKSKKQRQSLNNNDIYVDNLANLGKVITVKELFIDTMDLEEIKKLPCHILAEYGKRYITLKQEKEIILNQLDLLGISNPEKVIHRIQKVPIYCKDKINNFKFKNEKDNSKKNNKKNESEDEQKDFIYGFIFQIICGIILFSILAFVVYNRIYANK